MTPTIRLQQIDGIPLAVIRRQVKVWELSRVVPECCGLAFAAVRGQNVQAGRNVAVYLDGSIRLEAGVEVHGSFAEQGEAVRSATPAGKAATTTHLGPYNELAAVHAAVRHWCEASGHILAGPNWEIYGHWQREWNSDPSKIRTDVYYLLAG